MDDVRCKMEDVRCKMEDVRCKMEDVRGEFDACILAVAHDEFKNIDVRALVGNGVVYDVKGALDRSVVDARL